MRRHHSAFLYCQKINLKRTVVRHGLLCAFLFAQEVKNDYIRNSTIIFANLLPRASKCRYIFTSADSKIGSC